MKYPEIKLSVQALKLGGILGIPLAVLFYSVFLVAQPPATLWTKTFGGIESESGKYVQQTSDGGYFVTGYTASFGPNFDDLWLIKTDENGDTLWTKTYGGSGEDFGLSGRQTSDGGYILAGYINGSTFHEDIIIVKTDVNGDSMWTKTFGGSERDIGYSIEQTTDGGYIITGLTNSFNGGAPSILLIRTNENGDTLWTRTYRGSTNDGGKSVKQTADGGYIIIGSKWFFSGYSDVWLLKTDAGGDTLWTKTYGGSHNDRGNSIYQTSDGGYIIVGTTLSFGAGYEVYLIRTDGDGDSLWTRHIGGIGQDAGYSVQQTNDGGYIISGLTTSFDTTNSDIWLIKTDANGDTLWTKVFGGSGYEEGYCVQQTSDGGYIITGFTTSFGGGNSDLWLIKVAPDVVSIDEVVQPVMNYQLYQNYPNPFNPTTSIQYAVVSKQFVSLKVYDILGKEIATLVNEEKPAGEYKAEFDGSSLASGIYFYRLQAGQFVDVKKMILMK